MSFPPNRRAAALTEVPMPLSTPALRIDSQTLTVSPVDDDGDVQVELSVTLSNPSDRLVTAVRLRALVRDISRRTLGTLEADEGPLAPGATTFVVATAYLKPGEGMICDADVILSCTVDERVRVSVPAR